jgi:hypothetical protein
MDTDAPVLRSADAAFVAGIPRNRFRNLMNGGIHRTGAGFRAKGEWRSFLPSEVFGFALANAICNDGITIGWAANVVAPYFSWVLLTNPESEAGLRKSNDDAVLDPGPIWQAVLGRYMELAGRMAAKRGGLAGAKVIRDYVQAQKARDLL